MTNNGIDTWIVLCIEMMTPTRLLKYLPYHAAPATNSYGAETPILIL